MMQCVFVFACHAMRYFISWSTLTVFDRLPRHFKFNACVLLASFATVLEICCSFSSNKMPLWTQHLTRSIYEAGAVVTLLGLEDLPVIRMCCVSRQLENLLAAAGKLSFGIILWHFEIWKLCNMHGLLPLDAGDWAALGRPASLAYIARYTLFVALLILLSIISWVFFQHPVYQLFGSAGMGR